MQYPMVQDEWRTLLELTRNGKSIARFGDGEFKMMDGAGYVREPPNRKLAAELRNVLRRPHPNCIVAIPTMDPRGPKYPTWQKHKQRFSRMLAKARGPFYSAFISRPDSAPWIRTREFAEEFAKLFRGRKAALLCEREGSLQRAFWSVDHSPGAPTPWLEICPSHEAYALIDAFEDHIVAFKPEVAILSCGMTATCLANRLTKRGIQAIDFGSGGSFIAKLLAEEACSPS